MHVWFQACLTTWYTDQGMAADEAATSAAAFTTSGRGFMLTRASQKIVELTVTGCTAPALPGCGTDMVTGVASCGDDARCEGLAFVESLGVCSGCMIDGVTPITSSNVDRLDPPAQLCAAPPAPPAEASPAPPADASGSGHVAPAVTAVMLAFVAVLAN